MINKVILMGRLTRDPELRHTGTGTPVAHFTVAVDNGFGDNRQTSFINCVAWNKQAEFVTNYFTKGKMIIVIGRIQTRSWDGQDGKKNYATEVVASEVSFGESKRNSEGASSDYNSEYSQPSGGYSAPQQPAASVVPAQTPEEEFMQIVDTDDDLPF